MATAFTGVKVIQTTSDVVNSVYKKKQLELDKKEWPNLFIVFKGEPSQSALCRVDATGSTAHLISDKTTASGIKPRNKEQYMALNMLLDDTVPVVIMTGKAGTGKTILALAAGLQKIEEEKYKKIILTRPMSQVGKRDLGMLPGTAEEKFMPYLGNFLDNLSHFGGTDVNHLMERYDIECRPLQLMRGSSFSNAYIICDEVQVLDAHEMLTLGTRVAEGSKIVLLGDLNQIDEKIVKTKTGLYEVMNSSICKESPLVGGIELLKVERGPVAQLFTEIFEGGK